MTNIRNMNIVKISKNVAAVKIEYSWKAEAELRESNDYGIATIEKIGSSLRVVKFEVGGVVYEGETEDRPEPETALVTPPASQTVVIDREKIARDPNLRNAMKAYYEKANIYKSDRVVAGGNMKALIDLIREVEVVGVASNVVTLEASFRWKLDGGAMSGVMTGIFTVETDGNSYKVLKLETGGKTY